MELLHTAPVDGRVCCAINDEVWVGRQSGGIAVFSASTGKQINVIELKADEDDAAAQVTQMVAVFDEVWVSTSEGRVHFIPGATRKLGDSMLTPGAEKRVPIVSMGFNGHIAIVAAASGSVYVHHPLSHQRLATLATSTSPCTAAIQFYSFVVGGTASGALHLWDPLSGECLIYHGESKSEVVALLHEPTTGTIWVARANENVDVYAVDGTALQLRRRVTGLGRVTAMTAVSGTVVATTFTKHIVQLNVMTGGVVANRAGAHASFLHGSCKAMHQEVAQVWSVGNDGVVRVWQVAGQQVPVVPQPKLSPAAQAALASSVEAAYELAQGELRVEVQAERQRRVSVVDQLRGAREEAQELRLRLAQAEEKYVATDAELTAERKHRKEVEEHNAKLTKSVADITSNVAAAERERDSLRGELTQLKVDISKARTETSTKQTEKATVDRQLAEERTNKNVLEQRLRDVEGKLSSLQAEHRRVCDAAGSVAASQALTKTAQDELLKGGTALAAELEHSRKLNSLLSASMASMEYTIRRREEEDRDLTALLNAFRRRVADHVTDQALSALLLATIVRNAPRFDLECDEFTKAQLMERNGPFLQFIQSLRASDPEAYQKLVRYLQDPSIALTLPADAQVMLDRFVALASKEGEVSGEDLANFKRAIPGFTDSAAAEGRAALLAGSGLGGLGGLGGLTGGPGGPGAAQPTAGLAALLSAGAGGAADGVGAGLTAQDQEMANTVLIRELRGQQQIDENYIREQQAMFEFILKTRRLLAESLAILQKRTASARQVVDALCLNPAAANAVVPGASTGAAAPSRKSLQPLQNVFGGIVRELDELAAEVVQRYLTAAEKQRLGVTL